MRIDFGDQEHLLALPGDGLADHALGGAVAVHLGGVDQGHAKLDPEADGGDFLFRRSRPFADLPGPLAQRRNFGPVGQCHRTHQRALASASRSTRRKLPPQSSAISRAP